MTHDLFYNHVCLHHQFTANLCSCGITNVHDIHAELILPQPDGNMKTTTFKKALLESVEPDTQICLFKSIERTKDTEKYGKYLLIMTAYLLEDAQNCLDQAIQHMSVNTPDSMSRITKTDGSSVTHTNHIATSQRFQLYAQALQNMIPATIMTTNSSNAWKQRPPAALNYNEEDYPAINGSKQQHANETKPTDNSTNVDTAGDTITTIDLDKLQLAYISKCEAIQTQLQLQIAKHQNMLLHRLHGLERSETNCAD